MSENFFLLCAFSLWMSVEQEGPRTKLWSKPALLPILRQGAFLLAALASLALIRSLLIERFVPYEWGKEALIAVLLCSAWILNRFHKTKGSIAMAVLGFWLGTLGTRDDAAWTSRLMDISFFVFGMTLFQILFQGLRTRRAFSSVPRIFSGLSLDFITAAFLAMILTGMPGLWP